MTAERVDTATGEILPASPREQLAKLAQPFPRELVQRDPQGNAYVAHENVTQWLLGIVGPYSFKLVEIIRGDMPEVAGNPQGKSNRARNGTPELRDVVVGGVWSLTVEIDGRVISIEEVGEVGDVHNWPNDGSRLKQAASDAIKRCAMRIGLGLHLWSGDKYQLGERLQLELPRRKARSDGGQPSEASPAQAPEAGATSPAPASGSNRGGRSDD